MYDRQVPRYTSYPTAPQFGAIDEAIFWQKLSEFDALSKPLSLYIHIPFCKTMCLFCGCSVILNRSPERQSLYLSHLLKEISLVAGVKKRPVSQLHLGGGTPTSLTEEEFDTLLAHLHNHFIFLPDAEISIEIDPRTVFADQGGKLTHLKQLGFTRVSFGVQDLDANVQEAVRRRQSEEMTRITYEKARELGFTGINLDLIYGLPLQTAQSFSLTIQKLIEMRPDRLALYSYAKVPWLKKHQLAIPDATLPTPEEKLNIYVTAREALLKAGYIAIGMDHFALPSDPLTKAYLNKTLTRNFQGYSVQKADDMLGFGITSIGFLQNTYFQNTKHLEDYQSGRLPIARGYILTPEDIARREAIQSLMCRFELDAVTFCRFADPAPLIKEGLIAQEGTRFIATDLGRLFIRVIASHFDAYLNVGRFSNAI